MYSREWNAAQLLDTYITFGLPQWRPTFHYDLKEPSKKAILVNPVDIDARTEITTQMLSDKGYAVMV